MTDMPTVCYVCGDPLAPDGELIADTGLCQTCFDKIMRDELLKGGDAQ